jgi:DNA-binding HxlR family transcriptional regulator
MAKIMRSQKPRRPMEIEIILRILRALQKLEGAANFNQLKKQMKKGSSKTHLKYLRFFVANELLEIREGNKRRTLHEKIYVLTEKGKKAYVDAERFGKFLNI